MHKAVFKNGFFQITDTIRSTQHRHHLRLQIRRESGEHFCCDINRFDMIGTTFCGDPVGRFPNIDARRVQFFNEGFNQIDASTQQFNFTPRNSRRQHVRAQFYTINDDRMRYTAQTVDPLNRDGGCPCPVNLRAHFLQTMDQINDFGFARGVFQNGSALGQCRRHNKVFGRTHRGKAHFMHSTF